MRILVSHLLQNSLPTEIKYLNIFFKERLFHLR